ncbi:unnamed protein product [Moneuplotes crassus]|uniref:Uncharacterized protein n=1 Tax=Euplotes crassus TaxID=5936 RepID=A0AAD2DBW4_EUPCR|nr:unnamed protein product [Moneuplotes crassus]
MFSKIKGAKDNPSLKERNSIIVGIQKAKGLFELQLIQAEEENLQLKREKEECQMKLMEIVKRLEEDGVTYWKKSSKNSGIQKNQTLIRTEIENFLKQMKTDKQIIEGKRALSPDRNDQLSDMNSTVKEENEDVSSNSNESDYYYEESASPMRITSGKNIRLSEAQDATNITDLTISSSNKKNGFLPENLNDTKCAPSVNSQQEPEIKICNDITKEEDKFQDTSHSRSSIFTDHKNFDQNADKSPTTESLNPTTRKDKRVSFALDNSEDEYTSEGHPIKNTDKGDGGVYSQPSDDNMHKESLATTLKPRRITNNSAKFSFSKKAGLKRFQTMRNGLEEKKMFMNQVKKLINPKVTQFDEDLAINMDITKGDHCQFISLWDGVDIPEFRGFYLGYKIHPNKKHDYDKTFALMSQRKEPQFISFKLGMLNLLSHALSHVYLDLFTLDNRSMKLVMESCFRTKKLTLRGCEVHINRSFSIKLSLRYLLEDINFFGTLDWNDDNYMDESKLTIFALALSTTNIRNTLKIARVGEKLFPTRIVEKVFKDAKFKIEVIGEHQIYRGVA